jgi:hypothetical protein
MRAGHRAGVLDPWEWQAPKRSLGRSVLYRDLPATATTSFCTNRTYNNRRRGRRARFVPYDDQMTRGLSV